MNRNSVTQQQQPPSQLLHSLLFSNRVMRRRSSPSSSLQSQPSFKLGLFRSKMMMMWQESVIPRTVLVFALLSLSFFFFYTVYYTLRFPSGPFPLSSEQKLDKVLNEAAMEDKTVILTTLNEAWAAPDSIIDLFLTSFRIGDQTRKLLNHLVIISLDQKAYARCLQLHDHCFALPTNGTDFNEEAFYMTSSFLDIMWRRTNFLRKVLEMGYNFIFTDADVMWFRVPFPRFYSDADFQIATDHFVSDPTSKDNDPNTGLVYVKSNNRSIEFYKFWYSSRENYPKMNDQSVFKRIKDSTFVKNLGLKIKFLDTAFFGGFCEPSRDLRLVCTMHSTCCYGLDTKLHDLRIMLQDWKRFASLPRNVMGSTVISWSVPKNCTKREFPDLEL